MQWAIRAKRLYNGTRQAMIQDAVVVINGQQIAVVGPAAEVSIPAGIDVLDAGDRTLMPGMVDAHVHLLFTGSARSGEESRSASDNQALLTGV
jgi:imidazolonepropionase-like amidohydrolase